MPDFLPVVPVVVLTLVAIINGPLHKFMHIQVTSWALKRQGVKDEEIHKLALAEARRQRQNFLIQVLKIVLDFIKSMR